MAIGSHKNLDVWKKSMDLVTQVYSLTKTFPKEELYGLSSQMRRAAISIPSNLAEGRSKRTTRDYIRVANMSYGSASELETQLIIAKNLGFAAEDQLNAVINELTEIGKMLYGLVTSLEKKPSSP